MNGRVKLILYVIAVANIASSENVKSFKYVKGESEGYTNSSKDQELKLKGSLIHLDDKNFGRKRTGFEEAFERNMESSVNIKKQAEAHEFNSRKINNYNNQESEIYKPNIDSSVYWGHQHNNDKHTLRQNSDLNEHGNDRKADELRKGYKWANEKDMTFVRNSNIYSNDYQTNRANLKIDEPTRPKPEWENFDEKQTVTNKENQNLKHLVDSYSDLKNPYKYARREYMTEVNNRDMRNQNIYNLDSELASSHNLYPVHRIFDFNDDTSLQHSNFYKTGKGLVINLKTECPRESKHGLVHKIFFSSEPHVNSFSESSASYIPGAPLIPSSHMTNPIYYL